MTPGSASTPEAGILKKSSDISMTTQLGDDEEQEQAEEEKKCEDPCVHPGHGVEVLEIDSDNECVLSPKKTAPPGEQEEGNAGNEGAGKSQEAPAADSKPTKADTGIDSEFLQDSQPLAPELVPQPAHRVPADSQPEDSQPEDKQAVAESKPPALESQPSGSSSGQTAQAAEETEKKGEIDSLTDELEAQMDAMQQEELQSDDEPNKAKENKMGTFKAGLRWLAWSRVKC